MRKVISVIGNSLFVLLILLGVLSLYTLITSDQNQEKPPSLFGRSLLIVLTGSMEPSISPGDVVVIKQSTFNQINENDVITYRNGADFVTHRVTEVAKDESGSFFKTKGDANNTEDETKIRSEHLTGKVEWVLPKVGSIAEFLISPIGLSLMFFIVLVIIFSDKLFKRNKKIINEFEGEKS
ncbi:MULTISPECIES: signal peptidase I [Cytobacillus]|uniref:signal peptidase I n=1 Tax=Cytobacillus TaxID=2675230 RepID=UPI002811BA13|nr:signal peptidase I [Cytobacillus kochii]